MSQLLSRRLFVRAMGRLGGAACSAWLPLTGCEPQRAERPLSAVTPNTPITPVTASGAAGQAAPASSCPAFLTPVSEHFRQFGARSHIDGWQMPSLGSDFALRIGGLVERELTLTLAELESAAEQLAVVKTMVCVFGLTSTALWTGVPLRVVLERAGVDRTRAVRARFFGADGFENNLQLSAIFANAAPFEPLIAFRLYDQPLPPEHGYPFRLLLADRYGYKNIKWLARVELTDRDDPTGQYQTRGYPDAGLIEPQVETRGLRVRETLAVGPVELCGFAVSGYAGVTSVEVSVDGAAAQPAELTHVQDFATQLPELARAAQLAQPNAKAQAIAAVWSAWRCTLPIRAGEQVVHIRARDASGREADATDLHVIGEAQN